MTVLRDDLTTRAAYVSDASIYRRLPAAVAEPSSVAEIRELLATALDDAQAMVGQMINDLMSAQDEVRNIYKVGLNTSRLLMVLGDVVCSWLLLRQAEVALEKLGGDPGKDKAFYEGKVAAAQFFAQNVLPKITAERKLAESVDLAVMDLDESAF